MSADVILTYMHISFVTVFNATFQEILRSTSSSASVKRVKSFARLDDGRDAQRLSRIKRIEDFPRGFLSARVKETLLITR